MVVGGLRRELLPRWFDGSDMAVEIVILSGARQGERLLLEAGEFRAGDDPACEVFFDPQRDPPARDRCALFRLTDEGWLVEPRGAGELFVNQDRVAGKTRIRSGDLVRMSEQGPDFSFSIVTHATASSQSTPGAVPVPQPLAPGAKAPEKPAEPEPPPIPASRGTRPLPRTPIREPAPATEPISAPGPASGPPPSAPAEPWRRALWPAAGLAACVLLLVAVLVLTRGGRNGPRPPSPTAPESDPRAASTTPAREPPKPEVPATEPPKAEPKPEEPTDALAGACEGLRGAVYLIQVEVVAGSRSHSLPFATGCAIGENTLLTTAREACFLAKWHKQEGYEILAENPACGVKEEVREIRVHRDFAKTAAGESGDWVFVNLGLLTVQGKLPKAAPIASADELGELKEGLPVACFGFTFEEVDKILDTFEPQITRAKVYDPALLQLKAKVPPNACGSAILNAEGKLLGVYSTPAPEDTPVKDLHYATRVDPDSIRAWLEKRDAEIWVDPPIPETSPRPSVVP